MAEVKKGAKPTFSCCEDDGCVGIRVRRQRFVFFFVYLIFTSFLKRNTAGHWRLISNILSLSNCWPTSDILTVACIGSSSTSTSSSSSSSSSSTAASWSSTMSSAGSAETWPVWWGGQNRMRCGSTYEVRDGCFTKG